MSRLTAGELRVMQRLWERGELKPADLQRLFPEPSKSPARRSYLAILNAKGHVTRRKVGKSHLATAWDREACRRGYRVRFFTAAGLVNTYVEAHEQRQILRLEAQIARCDLVVLDELGYLPLDKIGAEHLFGFFSQCYERTSLIITTNLPFAEWPQVFAGDERLAGALIDRLTHRIHMLEIQGDRYRLQSSLRNRRATGGAEMNSTA